MLRPIGIDHADLFALELLPQTIRRALATNIFGQTPIGVYDITEEIIFSGSALRVSLPAYPLIEVIAGRWASSFIPSSVTLVAGGATRVNLLLTPFFENDNVRLLAGVGTRDYDETFSYEDGVNTYDDGALPSVVAGTWVTSTDNNPRLNSALRTVVNLNLPVAAQSGTLTVSLEIPGLEDVTIEPSVLPVTIEPRAFELVFRERTDANVPGEIIDSLTVRINDSIRVWLSLESVNGGTLVDDESVTGTASFSFPGVTALLGRDDFTILPSANNFLLRSGYVLENTLFSSGTLRVNARLNRGGSPVEDLPEATLPVTIVPRPEFRLVFEPATVVTVRGGNSTVVRVSLESIVGSLEVGEVVTVVIAASQFDGLSFAALEAMPSTVMFTVTETSTEITLLSSSLVNADVSDGGLGMDTVTVSVSASVSSAPAGVMFADVADLQVDIVKREFIVSFDPPDRVIIRKGERGPVTISMRGVDGSQLFGEESIVLVIDSEGMLRSIAAIGTFDQTTFGLELLPQTARLSLITNLFGQTSIGEYEFPVSDPHFKNC